MKPIQTKLKAVPATGTPPAGKSQVAIPTGFKLKTFPLSSNGSQIHGWEVVYWGKRLYNGAEATEKKAREEAWKAVRNHVETAGKAGKNRNLAQMRLRKFLMTRPYLVCGVFEHLLSGMEPYQVIQNAELQEKAWYHREPKEFRLPIPSHHRSLTPEQAAERIISYLEMMGYFYVEDGVKLLDQKKFHTYAMKLFGPQLRDEHVDPEEDEDDDT